MNLNDHIWTSSVSTDITIRWRMKGWIPPSEQPEIRKKWKYFQDLPLRKLDDAGKANYEQLLIINKVARIK